MKKEILSLCKKNPSFNKGAGSLPVFGEGPSRADIMIIGEAPGRVETRLGRPFMGRAGRFLEGILEETLKRPREAFYITNTVKVWPRVATKRGGRTRPPTKNEIALFLPFLREEIKVVRPKVIIAVGKTATGALFDGPFTPGKFISTGKGALIMPVYHPAYILRKQKTLKESVGNLKKALRKARRALKAG